MNTIKSFVLFCAVVGLSVSLANAEGEDNKPIRAGMIGIDTSHAVAFTKLLQDPKAAKELAGLKIVAAFPVGSPDIPASRDRIQGYTKTLRKMGVEIVDSMDALLERVDVVLIESVDGRAHLKQAEKVIAAGKPLFIDKPMTASLADAMRIFRMAKEKNVPCFSASPLRFGVGAEKVRDAADDFGRVKRCTAWSPLHLEPHHPDLFWYGIHGVEIIFTVLGPGCKTVSCVGPEKVAGVWKDGREGVYLAKKDYGAMIEGDQRSGELGKFKGYGPLVAEIVKFFKTGKSPVASEETLEILAFMEAADASKLQGGKPVSIESVMKKAQEDVEKGEN